MEIFVNVTNQKLSIASSFCNVVSGSQEFVKFKFILGEEWNGLLTFAQFTQNGRAYNSYLNEENCAYLPSEIQGGVCTLMLYGADGTIKATTNYLTLKVENSALVSDASSTDISQSLYDQLIDRFNKLSSRFDNIIAHNNDTDGNSELLDIRTGADGIVYQSAGSSVRSQLHNINLALGRESNFFPEMESGRFNTSDATEISDNNFLRTLQFIDIASYQTVTIMPAKNACVLFYDSDRNYLSHSYITAGDTLIVSENQGTKIKIYIQSTVSHDLKISTTSQGDYVFRSTATELNNHINILEDRLHQLNADFADLTGNAFAVFPEMEYGRIDTSTLGNISDSNFIRTSGYISVSEYLSVTVTAAEGYNIGIILYDENYQKIRHQYLTPQSSAILSGNYARLFIGRANSSYSHPTINQPVTDYVSIIAANESQIYTKNETDILLSNLSYSPLYGKKWVTCGDSFTEGDFTGYTDSNGHTFQNSDAFDPEMNCYKTYPWYIAKRNQMTLINEAKCGTTMALTKEYVDGEQSIDYKTPFSYQRYTNIPNDADYITLWFGINDSSHTYLGTIDDTTNTTFFGAWNMVLEYLIEHHPYAKIGIIVTESCSASYRNAIKQCALKWGIPYLDMMGDDKVPVIFGRETSLGMCQRAKELRTASFQVSANNQHPNLKAHEYQSTFIENWMKSL